MNVDLSTNVGSVRLPNPVMTAAGTSGHGAELGAYFDLSTIGAVVVKSLSPGPWQGNAAPRVHELKAGMINAIGLQNGGVEAWLEHDLPVLESTGARVVASIWGFTVEEFAKAAAMLASAGSRLTAVEVNVSCPNTESGGRMFSHDRVATAEVMSATASLTVPRWAKLSPNTADIVEIAGVALESGAEALTLTNTLVGLSIDTASGRPRLGNTTGGVSGAALHPIAVRCLYQCRAAYPDAALIGVGGVATAEDAVEFLMAGADAVEVGTATFADPRATYRLVQDLKRWAERRGLSSIRDIVGTAHGNV